MSMTRVEWMTLEIIMALVETIMGPVEWRTMETTITVCVID